MNGSQDTRLATCACEAKLSDGGVCCVAAGKGCDDIGKFPEKQYLVGGRELLWKQMMQHIVAGTG